MSLWRRILSLPLRLKLAISILIVALMLVGVGSFAVFQHNQATPPTESVLVAQLLRERLDNIAVTIGHHKEATAQIANNPVNLDNFAILSQTPDNADSKRELLEAFRQVLNTEASISAVRFVNLDGQVLVSVPDSRSGFTDKNELYYLSLRNNLPRQRSTDVFISKLSDGSTPAQDFVAIPVVGDQAIGFVVVTIDVTGSADPNGLSVFRSLRSLPGNETPIRFYLINIDYRILAPDRELVNPDNDTIQLARQLRLQATDRPSQYVSPFDKKPVLGMISPVENTQYTLVAEMPYGSVEAVREGSRFALPLLILIIFGVAVIGLIGLLLDLMIVHPIEALVHLAREAIQGRSTDALPAIDQNDELGVLYNTVNALATQVRRDQHTVDERVSQRTRAVEATREIGQALGSIRDLDMLLREVASLIRTRFSDIGHVQVYMLDETRSSAQLKVSTGSLGTSRLGQGKHMPVDSSNIIGRSILAGEPIVAMDTDPKGEYARAFLPGMRSEVVMPLMVAGQIIGALDLQSAKVEAFSENDVRVYRAVADQLAITMSNAQLFEESQQRLAEIEALNQQLVGDAWYKHLDARRDRLPAAMMGMTANSANTSAELWSPLQREAAQSGDVAERMSTDTVTFAVPVSLRGQVLGAIEWDIPRVTYNDNARQLARELAARLAISADNARLFEQAQRLAERERLVNDISSKLTQQSDVAEILKVAVREVGQALRMPNTSIRLATSKAPEPGEVEESN